MKIVRDSKFQVSYVDAEGRESAFRCSPDIATLIVAAPDILRIAKWAVTMLHAGGKPDQCYFDEARAIIASAEGQEVK